MRRGRGSESSEYRWHDLRVSSPGELVRQWLCESYQIASSGISTGASMINIDLNFVINRPVEEVWNGLTSPSIAERWMSGLLHASVITDGAWGVGAQFRKVQRFMGLRTEMVYDLVTYEPNTKLAFIERAR